jgi:hypothetical protein
MLGDTIKGTLTVAQYGFMLSMADFKTANFRKQQEGTERGGEREREREQLS